MQAVQENPSRESGGLRERKRLETYARIQVEAMRLFGERGFEATTLDDIAEAANVSRRNVLNYFSSKEEIVFSTKAALPDLVADAIRRRPAKEPLLDMVENALVELAASYQSPQVRGLAQLIRDTPALRAGDQAKYEQVEQVLARTLAERKQLPESDISCRVAAATAIGIQKLAVAAWLNEGDVGLEVHSSAAFGALRNIAR